MWESGNEVGYIQSAANKESYLVCSSTPSFCHVRYMKLGWILGMRLVYISICTYLKHFNAALLEHCMCYTPSPHRDKLYLLNLDLQKEQELKWPTNSSLYDEPSTSTKCQDPRSDVSSVPSWIPSPSVLLTFPPPLLTYSSPFWPIPSMSYIS